MANFTQNDVLSVWQKGIVVPNVASTIWRKDQCGAWIKFCEYGNRKSQYGWEIDHITPQSKGGTDILSNLRPLHWKNNMEKLDGKLSCKIKADGNKNVEVK